MCGANWLKKVEVFTLVKENTNGIWLNFQGTWNYNSSLVLLVVFVLLSLYFVLLYWVYCCLSLGRFLFFPHGTVSLSSICEIEYPFDNVRIVFRTSFDCTTFYKIGKDINKCRFEMNVLGTESLLKKINKIKLTNGYK